MLENTGVELQEWDWWHKKDRVDALLQKMSSERCGCGMGRWTRLQNENNQFLKSWELTFVDLPVRQLECFISPFQRLGRGGRTVPALKESEGSREEWVWDRRGSPMLASVFPAGVCYRGRREEETGTLPLEFLLGQVTGNAARNWSSPEPPVLEEPYRACISTS